MLVFQMTRFRLDVTICKWPFFFSLVLTVKRLLPSHGIRPLVSPVSTPALGGQQSNIKYSPSTIFICKIALSSEKKFTVAEIHKVSEQISLLLERLLHFLPIADLNKHSSMLRCGIWQ